MFWNLRASWYDITQPYKDPGATCWAGRLELRVGTAGEVWPTASGSAFPSASAQRTWGHDVLPQPWAGMVTRGRLGVGASLVLSCCVRFPHGPVAAKLSPIGPQRFAGPWSWGGMVCTTQAPASTSWKAQPWWWSPDCSYSTGFKSPSWQTEAVRPGIRSSFSEGFNYVAKT